MSAYPYRLVFQGGPCSGAVVPTTREPEPVYEMDQPLDWCVCDDGTVVETVVQRHTYRLTRLDGWGSVTQASYLCEGWALCPQRWRVRDDNGQVVKDSLGRVRYRTCRQPFEIASSPEGKCPRCTAAQNDARAKQEERAWEEMRLEGKPA